MDFWASSSGCLPHKNLCIVMLILLFAFTRMPCSSLSTLPSAAFSVFFLCLFLTIFILLFLHEKSFLFIFTYLSYSPFEFHIKFFPISFYHMSSFSYTKRCFIVLRGNRLILSPFCLSTARNHWMACNHEVTLPTSRLEMMWMCGSSMRLFKHFWE